MRSGARSRVTFLALLAVCLLGGGAYVGWAAVRGSSSTAGTAASARVLHRVTGAPFVLFLTSPSGDAPFDELAVAPLATPGRRYLVGMSCDRVAMTGAVGICVRHDVGIGVNYDVTFFDRSFRRISTASGGGIPSRARVSPSGRLAAVTSFVQGDSYTVAGQFSTTTTIFATRTGKVVVRNLEELGVLRDGKRFEPLNRNFWGVTFVDDRHFYATMGAGAITYLVRGDLATRTVTTVHENVECPSLSPGGTAIGFKKRTASGAWRFTVLNLATGAETSLAERRSVDDQLAWADPGHLLYGIVGAVWTIRADGRGRPRVLLPDADSPTVVRPPAPGV